MRSFWKAELSEVRLLRLSSADRKNVDLRESLAIHEEARVALESEARAASGAALMDASLRMRYLGVLLGYSYYAAHGAVDFRTACDRLQEGYTFSRACAAANLDLVGRTPEHFARVHFDLLLMDSSRFAGDPGAGTREPPRPGQRPGVHRHAVREFPGTPLRPAVARICEPSPTVPEGPG
ncbi:MAG: hypothetical protein IPK67_00355 [Planctomycetes bacterium]|nr:hypothetical protein [Planctomycetota bacterium]